MGTESEVVEPLNRAMARVIHAAAKESGVTLETLGETIGIPKTTIYGRLKSKSGFSAGEIAAASQVLGIPFIELARRAIDMVEREGHDVMDLKLR